MRLKQSDDMLFIKWDENPKFVGKLVELKDITIKDELKKMAVFKNKGGMFLIGNVKIISCIMDNDYESLVGKEFTIEKIDEKKTSKGRIWIFTIDVE